MLNLKRATNLNKLDVYAITNFESLNKMHGLDYLSKQRGSGGGPAWQGMAIAIPCFLINTPHM
jgi:hypothetical protein